MKIFTVWEIFDDSCEYSDNLLGVFSSKIAAIEKIEAVMEEKGGEEWVVAESGRGYKRFEGSIYSIEFIEEEVFE